VNPRALEISAITRSSHPSTSGWQLDVDPLTRCLLPERYPELVLQRGVPARRLGDRGGERRGARLLIADPLACVVEHQVGDAEARVARDPAGGPSGSG
jgi:hypothetical protein